MVLNRSYIACYSKPRSVIKNLHIGLSKRNKMKWYKGKRSLSERLLNGSAKKILKVKLKKKSKKTKSIKKGKKNKKPSKKSKKKSKNGKVNVVLSKGKAFGIPSTIKQIN